MMKTLIHRAMFLVLFTVISQAVFAADNAVLMRHLEERITLQEKYRDFLVAEAKGSVVAKELVSIENEVGQEWVDYLKYVKSTGDTKLVAHVLTLELLDEIRGCFYDLEFVEDAQDKKQLQEELANWKAKKKEVDAAIQALGVK